MKEIKYIYGMTQLQSGSNTFNSVVKKENDSGIESFMLHIENIANRVDIGKREYIYSSFKIDKEVKNIGVKASNGKVYKIPLEIIAPYDLLNQKDKGLSLKYPLIIVSESGEIEVELYKAANIKYRVYSSDGDYPELLIDNSKIGNQNTVSIEGVAVIEEREIVGYEKGKEDTNNIVEPDPEKEPMILFGLSSLQIDQDFWSLNPASRKEGFDLGYWYNTIYPNILKELPTESVRMILRNNLEVDEKGKSFRIKASNGTTYRIPFIINYTNYLKADTDHKRIKYPVIIIKKDGRLFIDSYSNIRNSHKVILDDGSPTDINLFLHKIMGTGAYVNTKGIKILPSKLWTDDEEGKVKEEKTNSYYVTYMGTLLNEIQDMNTLYTMINERLRKVVTPETSNNLIQKKGDIIYLKNDKNQTIQFKNKHNFQDVFLLVTAKGNLEIVRSPDIYKHFKTIEGEIINSEAHIYGFKEVQLNKNTKMDTSALFINVKDIPRERFKITNIKRHNINAIILKEAPNMIMELEKFMLELESKGSPLITRQIQLMYEYNMINIEPYTAVYGEDNRVEIRLDNLPTGMSSIVLLLDSAFILKVITLRDLLNDYTSSANTELIPKEIKYNKITVFKRKQGEQVYAAHIPLNKRVEITDNMGRRILNNVSDGLPHAQGDFVVVNGFTIEGTPDLRGIKAINGLEFIKTYSLTSFSK